MIAALSSLPHQSAVWPWEVEPYRLWSLLDMKPFDVAATALGACNIAIAGGQANAIGVAKAGVGFAVDKTIALFRDQLKGQNVTINYAHDADTATEAQMCIIMRQRILSTIEGVEESLRDAALPQRFHDKISRIKKFLETDKYNADVVSALLTEIAHDLVAELSEPMFLCIAPANRGLYEQKDGPPFGPSVAEKFDASSRDIAAAARCLALDECTASVSHLMRALEAPLQQFAKRMNVSFPAPTDLENWKTIVDNLASKIEAEVKRLEGTTKSHARNDELRFLGDVALDFRHFKNAWRNDVAHGREWYDPREATRVYDAVKHFMQRMAEIA